MRLVFTAKARTDLIRIGDYIARDNQARALSFVDELEARCRVLPATPLAYPLAPRHENTGIRRLVHGNYLIFYRVSLDELTILRVLPGAMDYEPVLFPEQ